VVSLSADADCDTSSGSVAGSDVSALAWWPSSHRLRVVSCIADGLDISSVSMHLVTMLGLPESGRCGILRASG